MMPGALLAAMLARCDPAERVTRADADLALGGRLDAALAAGLLGVGLDAGLGRLTWSAAEVLRAREALAAMPPTPAPNAGRVIVGGTNRRNFAAEHAEVRAVAKAGALLHVGGGLARLSK